MQSCVWVIFCFRPPHQIVAGNAVIVSQHQAVPRSAFALLVNLSTALRLSAWLAYSSLRFHFPVLYHVMLFHFVSQSVENFNFYPTFPASRIYGKEPVFLLKFRRKPRSTLKISWPSDEDMLSGEVPHSACQGRDNAGVRTRVWTASGRTAKLNYFIGAFLLSNK